MLMPSYCYSVSMYFLDLLPLTFIQMFRCDIATATIRFHLLPDLMHDVAQISNVNCYIQTEAAFVGSDF